MDYYNTQFYLKTIDKTINIKNFKTAFQKELCKAFLEENVNSIQLYINSIINEITDIDVQDITILDKLLILMRTRIRSIGNIINLSLQKEDKKYDVTYSIADVFNNILKLDISSHIIQQGDFFIKLNIPKVYDEIELYATINRDQPLTLEDIMPFFIELLIIKDSTFSFKDLNYHQRLLIINNLPINIVQQIIKYIETTINNIKQIELYKDFTDKFYLNIIDGSVFEYIKFLFNENLYNLYQVIFILVKHVGLSAEYVESLTPIERDLYLKLLEKENAESAKHSNQEEDNIPINSNLATSNIDSYMNIKGG